MSLLLLVFFLAVLLQLVYLVLLMAGLRKKPDTTDRQFNHPVSVIVCAHDEAANLRELIPILLEQDHPQFEVIIVNDRSNDETYDLLLQMTSQYPQLRMVNVNHLPDGMHGKKYGLTLGIKAARHEIILLTDADCRPSSNQWITMMSSRFSAETEFVLGYSPYTKYPGILNLFIRFETLLTGMFYIAFARLGMPYMGVGRNLAYRKSMFLKVKGFTDLLPLVGGDDDLLVNRYAHKGNTVTCIGTGALVFSEPKKNFREFFWQKVRHLKAGIHYRFSHRAWLGFFSITQAAVWFLGIALLFSAPEWMYATGGLVLRTLVLCIAAHLAARRFGHAFESWAVPLLDILFVFYYLSTGWVALVSKKVPWKS